MEIEYDLIFFWGFGVVIMNIIRYLERFLGGWVGLFVFMINGFRINFIIFVDVFANSSFFYKFN